MKDYKDIEDREEHQGTVEQAADGTDVLIDVMFKTRGKTRANRGLQVSPLQLNFKKKGIITNCGVTSLNL